MKDKPKRRRKLFVIITPTLGLLLSLGAGMVFQCAMAQDGATKAIREDIVLKGDAKCTRCHDEDENYPVLSIGKTKHGTAADGRTPTCTSCHGESEPHVSKPEKVLFPDLSFGRNSTNPSDERNQACLNCHQGGQRMHWAGSSHANRNTPVPRAIRYIPLRTRFATGSRNLGAGYLTHDGARCLTPLPARFPISIAIAAARIF